MSTALENKEKAENPADQPGQGKSTLRDFSLKIAGYLYSVGDISMFIAGVLKGANASKEAAAGAIWFAGGVAAALFGNEKPERKLRRARRELSSFLISQGMHIPAHSPLATHAIEQESHSWDHIADFLYKNPSQMLNGSYALGSVMLFKSGLDQKKPGQLFNGQMLSGIAVETGALGGLLIPEYKTPPTKKPEGPLGKVWHWMREKPLRFSGIAYWINNGGLLKKAIDDMKFYATPAANHSRHANKSYIFSFITLGTYVLANLLLFITPKEEANKKQPLDSSSLEKAAAEVIAMQPPALQEQLVQQVAGYLASRSEIGSKAEALAARLTEKIANASRQPVAQPRKAPAPTQETTHWRARTEAELAGTPVPGLSPSPSI